MRHPSFAGLAVMSLMGLTCFAVACAKSEDPQVDGILQNQNPTDPADAGEVKSAKIPPKSNPESKPKPVTPPVVDAGPADTGAPPAGDDDDDTTASQPDCAQDTAHTLAWSVASLGGGGTECTSGGSECAAATECCFVYPIPGLGKNYCLPK